MAFLDSADQLSRLLFLLARPASDNVLTTTNAYALLTEGQQHVFNLIAAHAPHYCISAPTTLLTSDGGITYQFPSNVTPLWVEVYDQLDASRPLKPASYWDQSGDYVWEGNQIRSPGNDPSVFSFVPVARYVAPPGTLDGSNAPTLQPTNARLLGVYWAAMEFAIRGGFRDPAPYEKLYTRYWMGDPKIGDVGLLGQLKAANPFLGASAYTTDTGGVLQGVSTGAGYQKLAP